MKLRNLARRFHGLLPITIDVETAGLNSATDALLEIAAVTFSLNQEGKLSRDQTYAYHIEPFDKANLDQDALKITGIDPYQPLRFALPEIQGLHRLFTIIREQLERNACYRAVLVGHNAWFDLSFILAATKRTKLNNNPFHTFTTLDTASLAAVALGETVLARAARRAHIPFDPNQAHSAIYDAERTAELFCYIFNKWRFILPSRTQ